uniref:Uncharacterized protein n=1 Tax=Clytia hemisphaerica TaxID=252671 RepID=A0A7M5WZ49_9CNID
YGWYFPDDHNVYKQHNRSIRKILLTDFCSDILKLELCKGVSSATAPKSTLHATPLKYDKEVQVPPEIRYRSDVCEVLVAGSREICRICNSSEKKKDVKDKSNLTPASKFAPLSKTNPQKVILVTPSSPEKTNVTEKPKNDRRLTFVIPPKPSTTEQSLTEQSSLNDKPKNQTIVLEKVDQSESKKTKSNKVSPATRKSPNKEAND